MRQDGMERAGSFVFQSSDPTPKPPASTAANSQPVLTQLRDAEYATSQEVIMRFCFVTAAGLLFLAYTGTWSGPIWALCYLGAQSLHYLFLSSRHGPERRWEIVLAHVGYAVTNLVFISLPLMLLRSGDPALVASAAFGFGTLVVFLLWRQAPPRSLLPIDMAVHVTILCVILIHVLPMIDHPLAQAATILCALAEAAYFGMALYGTTDVRHRLSAATKRGIEAEKMQAMGRLSGGVAHDFNNILTVIRGNLELYEEIDDPEERRKCVANAHAAALRAAALIAQLLSFSRRAPLDPVAVDAHAVIAEIASMAARTLPSGIHVEVESPPRRMPLHVDLDRLNAALLNMVINARDAIAERAPGTGCIKIVAALETAGLRAETPRGLPPGDYIRLSVIDDGPGMTPEQAARAFEPFYTTKPLGKGSGLGLASAKGFAKQSGGTMTIRLHPGETIVSLYLPATTSHERGHHPDENPSGHVT